MNVRNALAVVVASVIVYSVIKFLRVSVWQPLRLRRIMAKQGVSGPPFRFVRGQFVEMWKFTESFPDALPIDDFANLTPTVTPQNALYYPKYGKIYLYWWGTITRLAVRDPKIVKELMVSNHESLTRLQSESQFLAEVVGKGLLTQVGEKWASERRTLGPFFHQKSLEGMVGAIMEGAATELQKWEQEVEERGGTAELDVEPDLHKISGRIISRTAFGDEFEIGEQIFKFQTLLSQELLKGFRSTAYWLVPGYRNLPTKRNRSMNLYGSQVDALVRGIINARREAVQKGVTSSYGDDLLGRMLTAATEGWSANTKEFNQLAVFNNCKLFYFAGQDTVANAIGFMILMLALYPEWQDRCRQEVTEILGDEQDWRASDISRLKVVGMVFNETLRIFPPASTLTRVAAKDLQLEGLFIPKGMAIEFSLAAMHQDKDYWGDDVGKFNPERFVNGAASACTHPQAFSPFGLGPKFCIGNNFAVMEAKIVLAMMLRRFQLVLSPNYKHHPTSIMVQSPKFGLPIILKALKIT